MVIRVNGVGDPESIKGFAQVVIGIDSNGRSMERVSEMMRVGIRCCLRDVFV
jgi:hypothetical protein